MNRMISVSKDSKLSVGELLERISKKNFGLKIFYFVMGLLISAFAFNLFFEPYGVIPTGSSGLAYLIAYVINYDVALITLMLVTLVFSGKSYTKKMFNLPFLKKLGFFGFIMYLNNVYLRGPLLNSGLDISYKEYVLLFLGMTFAISLLAYYIVPLLVKFLKNILVFLKSKLICE